MAAVSGIEFGRNTYYLTGGSQVRNEGVAWHLMLTAIREAYDRTLGSGKFLMGQVRKSDPGWDSLAKSRQQCRVSEFPTSVVTFAYRLVLKMMPSMALPPEMWGFADVLSI